MQAVGLFELMRWGDTGWLDEMVWATLVTLAVALAGFSVGAVMGTVGARAKLSQSRIAQAAADTYTTVLRGIPDLLVIYLFYFGGSAALSAIGKMFGHDGFIGMPAFLIGALAIGIVSGAYQTEVFRGAYLAIAPGELEAARAMGMQKWTLLRRIVIPQVLRFAIPGLGNVWQLVLKESALISVTGLVELLRQAQVGAGSTRQPFVFFFVATVLYLLLTSASGYVLRRAEAHARRGLRSA
jgi:octopine/nopaline transport system permease protein